MGTMYQNGIYYGAGGSGGGVISGSADLIAYDNGQSHLQAGNVQKAIDIISPVAFDAQVRVNVAEDLISENENDITQLKQEIVNKQDTLIAGSGITIAEDGKTISATGGGGGGSSVTMVDAESGGVNLTVDGTSRVLAKESEISDKQDKEIPMTTGYSYNHKNMVDANKTAYTDFEERQFGNANYFMPQNLMPTYGWDREMPTYGITVNKTGDMYNISGTATTNLQLNFKSKSGQIYIPLSELGVTTSMDIFTASLLPKATAEEPYLADLYMKYDLLDEDKNIIIGNKDISIGRGYGLVHRTVEIPEGAYYIRMYLVIYNRHVYDGTFQLAITTGATSTTNDILELGELTNVYSFPYKTDLHYRMLLTDYISNFGGGSSLSNCVCPENYGAVGDGSEDDYQAIVECLEDARDNGYTVCMFGKYSISQTINFNYNNLTVFINTLLYSGTYSAINIGGSQNNITIRKIESNGIGVTFGSATTNVLYNNCVFDVISAKSHCIKMEKHGVWRLVFQNRITFSLLSAGGDECNCIDLPPLSATTDGLVTENIFIGGQCKNADWAVYGAGGNSKFQYIQVEENIKGGFLISQQCVIDSPRSAESARDGEYPFIKFKYFGSDLGKEDTIRDVRFVTNEHISINEIDVSENSIVSTYGSSIPIAYASTLKCTILPYGARGEDKDRYCVLSRTAYVVGQHLIFQPFTNYVKYLDEPEYDLNNIDEKFGGLPTKIIANTNSIIKLNPSYCCIGFKELVIEQIGTNKVSVYDWKDTLIFDGNNYDAGSYKIEFCAEAKDETFVRYDGTGQFVSITQLDKSSDSGSGYEWSKIGEYTVSESAQTITETFGKTYKKAFAEIKFAPGTQSSRVYFAFTNTVWSGNISVTDAISTVERYMTVSGESFGDNRIFLNYTASKPANELGYTMALSNPKAHNINGFAMYCDNGDKLIPTGTTFTVYGIE